MDGSWWMNGRMDLDGWMDGSGWMDLDGWIDGWMNGWLDGSGLDGPSHIVCIKLGTSRNLRVFFSIYGMNENT